MMTWDLTLGNVLTAGAVVVSAASLVRTWRHQLDQRRQERADLIRTSAGTTIAKLERWAAITRDFFSLAQPAITRADMALAAGTDCVLVRDELWSACWSAQQQVQSSIRQESVELAYAGLYGYDPRIRDLYAASIDQLRVLWGNAFDEANSGLQRAVLKFGESLRRERRKPHSAELGNELRVVLGTVEFEYEQATQAVVDALREQLLKVISASDRDIVDRRVEISMVPSTPSARSRLSSGEEGARGRWIRTVFERLEHGRPYQERVATCDPWFGPSETFKVRHDHSSWVLLGNGIRRGAREREHAVAWVAAGQRSCPLDSESYTWLSATLATAGFDRFVEAQCQAFDAPPTGKPSVPPGQYFRLLLVGYFEELDSEREIAARAADSLAVRSFAGLPLDAPTPDHSTIARTRRLIDVETHQAIFGWVVERLNDSQLLGYRAVAADAVPAEADTATPETGRDDGDELFHAYLIRLAITSRVKTPTRAALARLARLRPKRALPTIPTPDASGKKEAEARRAT